MPGQVNTAFGPPDGRLALDPDPADEITGFRVFDGAEFEDRLVCHGSGSV
jgi:hypothetical protein